MRTIVITPPAPVVSWEEADDHLKLDGDDTQKAHVERLIEAATRTIDGPMGWLGRAIGTQTLEARYDTYCAHVRLRLPCPPLIDIVSIRYLDNDRTLRTVDEGDYELVGGEIWTVSDSAPWTGALIHPEGIRVRYRAGYDGQTPGENDDFEDRTLPESIKAAILLMVGDLYRFRETTSDGSWTPASVPMSTTVQNLLSAYRVYS